MKNRQDLPASALWANIFLTLVTGALCLAGYEYIQAQFAAVNSDVHARLRAAAKMEVARVEAWRSERVGDSHAVTAALPLMPAVQRALRGQASPADQKQLATWFTTMQARYKYQSIALTDLAGRPTLSVGGPQGDPALYKSMVAEDSNDLAAALVKDATGHETLRLSIYSTVAAADGKPIGFIVFTIDPELELFAGLRNWADLGKTAEMILLKREHDSVVFVSDTRTQEQGSVSLVRRPLTDMSSPAVQVASGMAGDADGYDYRGVPVLASGYPIPNSSWLVEAKIDRREAFATQQRETNELILLLVVFLLLIATIIRLLINRRNDRHEAERREAQKERLRALARYEALAKQANDAIVIWEGTGRVLEVNNRAMEMYGYSREEFLSCRLVDFRAPEAKAGFPETLANLRSGNGLLFETIHISKNGRIFPVEISTSRLETEGGEIFQAIIRDISERKNFEAQILRLNRLYAVLSECDSASHGIRNEDELLMRVCEIVVRLGGFPIAWAGKGDLTTNAVTKLAKAGREASYLDEIVIQAGGGSLGSGPTGICIRENRAISTVDFATDPIMAPWREAAARHGLHSSICLPLRRKAGMAYVLGIYSAEPGFFNEEESALAEKVAGSLSFALERIDLEREREAAENRRRVSEERLALAMEAANEAYWDWRLDTNEWFFSPRYLITLGYQPGEVDLNLSELRNQVHPDDRAAVEHAQDTLISGQQPSCTVEFRVRCKDGRYIWMRSTAKVVERDEFGIPRRIVGARTDITERKALEQEFLQAQKMESIGRLAGGVAHDFNNFLTVINGNAALMLESILPEDPLADSLKDIVEAGERAAALTRQLLAFSRKHVEHREPLDINSIVTNLQKMLRNLLGESRTLRVELTPDTGMVMADATHLEQVIMNLTVNARDATQSGGTVTIRTELRDRISDETGRGRIGTFVRLTVEDNGSGMSEETRQRIFEPFFTTKDKSRGTGLGLSTVHGIVAASGGFIEVESELGKGSAFRVYLPVTEEKAAAGNEGDTGVQSLRGTETVLLVEDEPATRRYATEILKRYGYRVFGAENGEEAIEISSRYRKTIHAVVSDIMMPGMNGTEAVRHLLAQRPQLKVLYVSGFADDSIRPEDLTGPVTAFLQKPYSPEALATNLRELLSRATEVPEEDLAARGETQVPNRGGLHD